MKVSEYLKLIPRGLKNGPEVLKGFINDALIGSINKEDRELILLRRVECLKCPFNSSNASTSKEYKDITGESYKTERTDIHCAFCGCPVNTRTASLGSNCGIEYWNEMEPE